MDDSVITIQSFFGIGDLLFVTPTLRVIKEAYPTCKIAVNTNRPMLLQNNPYIDILGNKQEGVKLMYTAPDSGRLPTEHHIIEDWLIVCKSYGLKTKRPEIRPELYIEDLPKKIDAIGVQIRHKRLYHGKRIWPNYDLLSHEEGFLPIKDCINEEELVREVSKYKAVVCPEGGISHIAAALKMPAVVIFGGFSDPEWTGYPDHINITTDVDCKHCYNHKPCDNNFKCWKKITVEYVKEKVLRYLGEAIEKT